MVFLWFSHTFLSQKAIFTGGHLLPSTVPLRAPQGPQRFCRSSRRRLTCGLMARVIPVLRWWMVINADECWWMVIFMVINGVYIWFEWWLTNTNSCHPIEIKCISSHRNNHLELLWNAITVWLFIPNSELHTCKGTLPPVNSSIGAHNSNITRTYGRRIYREWDCRSTCNWGWHDHHLVIAYCTQILHVFYIYLHDWEMFRSNVGKNTSTMVRIWAGKWIGLSRGAHSSPDHHLPNFILLWSGASACPWGKHLQ